MLNLKAILTVNGLIALTALTSTAQTNLPLKQQLDSIFVTDQKYREYLSVLGGNPTLQDSLSAAFKVNRDNVASLLWQKQNEIDSLNLRRVEAIFKEYGYPGKTLVGTPTNESAWYVIQHSPAIKTYFPLIAKAGKQKELPFPLVAMMQDRLLSQEDKPQLYGTQVLCYPPKKQPDHTECFVWPIDKPAQVNKRRKEAGFPDTVEENAKRLSVDYRILSKAQVKEIYETP
ncbi:DUF6624 domain-containing protein [Spirosoma utsteinense]|uniref:DUF6624 domain-containing protein n=1 Tax=Spirosoma utsteinense TaxID=2585773 RepID=UPI0016449346|nr:DUF6624 domain-containing protein [Spirosoma utsteinense]MBC3789079.1 hypothetical protein [Spirosoma utsteinense]